MAATRNARIRLEHILFHIRGVEETIAGISYETFRSVYYMELTVERAVAIICEAVRALPTDLLAKYPHGDWQNIIGIGNFIRHEYEKIDPEVVRSHRAISSCDFLGVAAQRPHHAAQCGAALLAAMGHVFQIVCHRSAFEARRCNRHDVHAVAAMRTGEQKARQVGWRNVLAVHDGVPDSPPSQLR
jgi:uncharacterized protein with HEPN domain